MSAAEPDRKVAMGLTTRTEWVDATTQSVVNACRMWEGEGWAIRQVTLTKQKQHGLVVRRWVRFLFGLAWGEQRDDGFWMRDEIEAIVVLERPGSNGSPAGRVGSSSSEPTR